MAGHDIGAGDDCVGRIGDGTGDGSAVALGERNSGDKQGQSHDEVSHTLPFQPKLALDDISYMPQTRQGPVDSVSRQNENVLKEQSRNVLLTWLTLGSWKT